MVELSNGVKCNRGLVYGFDVSARVPPDERMRISIRPMRIETVHLLQTLPLFELCAWKQNGACSLVKVRADASVYLS